MMRAVSEDALLSWARVVAVRDLLFRIWRNPPTELADWL